MTELQNLLGAENVKTDSESLNYYGKDWTTYFDIKASAIVFPRSTEDVQKLVLWARKNKIALVPSGGRTGLSGAAVATQGEVVVSFEKMNRILEFNPTDQTVLVEAGVVTESLQKFAADNGLYYPVDFAARGSSHIAGNVTGAGEILSLNNGLVKNATGYDLRHLFIGSEGTLGFVTKALIRLSPPPPPLQVMVLGVTGLDAVMKVFAEFKKKTTLVAFEMFSEKALQKVLVSTGLQRPFETVCDYYVLAEVEIKSTQEEESALSVFEACLEQGLVNDGAVSQSETQAKNFWRLREDISESLAKYSPYKNDISVAISKVPAFMNDLDQVCSNAYPTWEVIWFGHIGDGNLHINILRPQGMSKEEFVKECRNVDPLVFKAVQKQAGSISAEHGVGLTKKSFLTYTKSPLEIELMRGIKKVFDPDLIMNPGKVL